MKKQITVEIRICDYCGSTDVWSEQCCICGKDICAKHAVNIEGLYAECLFICKKHKLTEKEKNLVRLYRDKGITSKELRNLLLKEKR